MTDLPTRRARSEDAQKFSASARARVDAAVVRLHDHAAWIARVPVPESRPQPARSPARLSCRLALREETIVVTLAGELDFAELEAVQETWAQVVRFASSRVVVDLSELQFIDSSGLHALLALRNELAPGVRLELVRGPACVDRVFALTGLNDFFAFASS